MPPAIGARGPVEGRFVDSVTFAAPVVLVVLLAAVVPDEHAASTSAPATIPNAVPARRPGRVRRPASFRLMSLSPGLPRPLGLTRPS